MSTSNIAVVIWIITARSRSTMRKSFIRLSINESCRRLWTSHVIHEWVMSHMSRVSDLSSDYVSMSRVVGYERVMSYMNQSCHIWVMSQIFHQVIYQWVVSSVMNESCNINQSCHIWVVSQIFHHIIYQWVVSCMNESCHTWISHVTYELCHGSSIRLYPNESRHTWMSHVTYKWVISRMNESSHVWMSHVTYKWVMSRMDESCDIWMSHITYNMSSRTQVNRGVLFADKWVMLHMNESYHIQ